MRRWMANEARSAELATISNERQLETPQNMDQSSQLYFLRTNVILQCTKNTSFLTRLNACACYNGSYPMIPKPTKSWVKLSNYPFLLNNVEYHASYRKCYFQRKGQAWLYHSFLGGVQPFSIRTVKKNVALLCILMSQSLFLSIYAFREFKRLALGLLDKCFQENEELTQMLLTYHLENWGGQTCLSLAVAIEHEEFLAHSSCQALLTDIWTGAMKNTHRSSIKVGNFGYARESYL